MLDWGWHVRQVCPYYIARHEVSMIESELLLMPYNYIMDYHIRSRLNLALQECVVIIDEAHNIVRISQNPKRQDSFCLESLSYDISARLLHQIENEIKELLVKNVAQRESKLSSLDEKEQQQIQENLERVLLIRFVFFQNSVVLLAVIQKIEDVIRLRLESNPDVSVPSCFNVEHGFSVWFQHLSIPRRVWNRFELLVTGE